MSKSFYWTIAAWCVFSSSFLLMTPATMLQGTSGKICVAGLGLIFWISLLGGIVLSIKTCRLGNNFMGKYGEDYPIYGRSGIACFFANGIASVFDCLLILSIIAIVALILFPPENQYLYFIIIFCACLSASLHCLLNGDIYRVLHCTKAERGRRK